MTLPHLADLALVDAIPTIDDVPDGTAPVAETVSRMAEAVVTGKVPASKPRSKPSAADLMSAFDGAPTARLVMEDEPTLGAPLNPVPSGSRTRKQPAGARSARPAGASDIQPLFATGLLLIATFVLDSEMAPTEPEAQAIAAPLANILARRIDLAAKLGQDASDTVALAVAVMSYGARVAPTAVERARVSYDKYQHRQRVDRAGRPPEPLNDRGADDVGSWAPDGAGTGSGPFAHPADALAKARGVGWGAVIRDLGGSSNGVDPVGADGGR